MKCPCFIYITYDTLNATVTWVVAVVVYPEEDVYMTNVLWKETAVASTAEETK